MPSLTRAPLAAAVHLFDIPPERISEIEIPTGLPMVYDANANCLRLLEGQPTDYNFGKGGVELLFERGGSGAATTAEGVAAAEAATVAAACE